MRTKYWFARILMFIGIGLQFVANYNALISGIGWFLFTIGFDLMCKLDLNLET